MDNPLIIASYPRSGSAWIRFILCNLHYSKVNHDFDTINNHIPTIENEKEIRESIGYPKYFKTHEKRSGNILHLVRHVGDVLISEYHFQRKFYNYDKSISEFIIENKFGENWRNFVRHHVGYKTIHYENLFSKEKLTEYIQFICHAFSEGEIHKAIEKSTFDKLQKIESNNAFISTNPGIKFIRKGEIGQWINHELADAIIQKNSHELKLMRYL